MLLRALTNTLAKATSTREAPLVGSGVAEIIHNVHFTNMGTPNTKGPQDASAGRHQETQGGKPPTRPNQNEGTKAHTESRACEVSTLRKPLSSNYFPYPIFNPCLS